MIALTGATGQLGHYVLQDLLKTVPAGQIVAIVRNPAKAQTLSQQGVVVRQADYSDEAALTAALQGVDKLLLISSSEVGQRAVQHRNVINAAKAAGVKFIAYTSLLHADTSPLGRPQSILQLSRCWPTRVSLTPCCVTAGILKTIWPARRRRWSTACLSAPPAKVKLPPLPAQIMPPRPPALSPVKAMQGKFMNWRVITPWTLSDPAAELSKQSGKNVVYQNLSEADFAAALKSVGLPAGLADMLADSDVGASKGGLFDDSRTLSTLIGRPTTSLAESVKGIL